MEIDKLIFWGNAEYDEKKFQSVKNTSWCKPIGGLWVSPVDSEYGWDTWCKENDFRSGHFTPGNFFIVELKSDARVYTIDSLEDLIFLHKKYPDYKQTRKPFVISYDFEKMSNDYDAIFLTEDGQWKTRLSEPNLYGWDCECVLILNKEAISPSIVGKVEKNLEEFKTVEIC